MKMRNMATRTARSKTSRRFKIIDLKPEETGVLSLVATYAHIPQARDVLETALGTATDRARQIGSAILDESANVPPPYKYMAQRFLNAGKQQIKNAEILKASIPAGLQLDRGV
jgi:hypothetical protein